ncbi:hypothetical protein [Sporichthya sp.]|uniref:hypothetical protein n=1 Tax=Sporichthya sp. TaxID=65475 RepID=UPI0017974696|nr:hypothetical protein [Sporichthya sp.]MBA3742840.1 hypothetical protein [Sporichthya sp.]
MSVSLALAGCGGSDDDDVAEPPAPSPTATASSAEPTAEETPEPGVDLEANAQLLAEIVDEIDESAKGFAQILQNPAKLKVHIYWKGQPPAEVKALEGTTGTGVEVILVEARLSKADVNTAIARISQAAQVGTVPAPDSISANKDFSGITIGFLESRFAANNNASVRGKYEAVAKVPVTIAAAAQHAPD